MRYPETFFARVRNHTGFNIITNAIEEKGYPIPEGLHSIGILSQEEYDRLLVMFFIVTVIMLYQLSRIQASARAVLGIGQPLISPTPYASLCRGYVLRHLYVIIISFAI